MPTCCCDKTLQYTTVTEEDEPAELEEEEEDDDDEKSSITNTQKAKNVLLSENIFKEINKKINENLSFTNASIMIFILTNEQLIFSSISHWIKLIIMILLSIFIVIFYGFLNDKIDINTHTPLPSSSSIASMQNGNSNDSINSKRMNHSVFYKNGDSNTSNRSIVHKQSSLTPLSSIMNVLSQQNSLNVLNQVSEEEKLSLANNASPKTKSNERRMNNLSVSSVIVNIDDEDINIELMDDFDDIEEKQAQIGHNSENKKSDLVVVDYDGINNNDNNNNNNNNNKDGQNRNPPSPFHEQNSISIDENIMVLMKSPSRSSKYKQVRFDINDENKMDKLREDDKDLDEKFYSMTKWIETDKNIFKDNTKYIVFMSLALIISFELNEIIFNEMFLVWIKLIIIDSIVQNILYTIIMIIICSIIVIKMNQKFYEIYNDYNVKLEIDPTNKTIFIYSIYKNWVSLMNKIFSILIALTISS